MVAILPSISYADNSLLISDIHFNPYYECVAKSNLSCNSLKNLIENPVESWPSIFSVESVNFYKEETNNAFLTQGLNNMAAIIKDDNISNVFITGDILSHEFVLNYKKLAPLQYRTPNDLADFSFKTIKYVLWQIKSKFPHAKVYMILGNNDSDKGDYKLASPKLLKLLANYLSNEVTNKSEFVFSFQSGGYFSVLLNNDQSVLVGINTNILSTEDKGDINIARTQLKWLRQILAQAKITGKKIIMLQHIPYGINLYKSAVINEATPLMSSVLQEQYLNLLKQYSSIITTIYAGHFHAEYLSLINSVTPLIGNLSFNTGFGNNPGFKVIKLNNNGSLVDYATYHCATPSDGTLDWQFMYKYSAIYGDPQQMSTTLNNFPFALTEAKVISYRNYYNGSNKLYLQPINQDSKWKYYYCGIMNVNKNSYNKCLKSIEFQRQF